MNEVVVGIVGLAVVLVLFLTGIELAFAMTFIGFLGFAYLISWAAAFNLLAKDFFDVLDSYEFTVIPLFILMGQVAFNSGIARRLFDAAYKFVGHIPGGLAMAENPAGRHLQWCLSVSHQPRRGRHPYFYLPAACHVASRPADARLGPFQRRMGLSSGDFRDPLKYVNAPALSARRNRQYSSLYPFRIIEGALFNN